MTWMGGMCRHERSCTRENDDDAIKMLSSRCSENDDDVAHTMMIPKMLSSTCRHAPACLLGMSSCVRVFWIHRSNDACSSAAASSSSSRLEVALINASLYPQPPPLTCSYHHPPPQSCPRLCTDGSHAPLADMLVCASQCA